MIIKNLRKNEDGSYDFDFSVDNLEAEFLMDHAIKDLIRAGIIKINEGDAEFQLEEDIKPGGTLQ
jgi:hypothetical protein